MNTQTTYNLIASNYKGDHAKKLHWQPELELFCDLLPQPAEIIDLGCGPGRETYWLAEHCAAATITGIDFAEEMIKLAPQHERATFLIDSIVDYVHPKQVDAIWARGALHHLSDIELQGALTSICSYLKPSGFLYTMDKFGFGDENLTLERYGGIITRYFNFFNEEKVTELANTFGFTIEQSRHTFDEDTEWLVSVLRRM